MDENITILEVVDNRNNEIFRIGDKTTNGVIAEFEANCIKMTNGKRFTYACTLRADGKKTTSEPPTKALPLHGVINCTDLEPDFIEALNQLIDTQRKPTKERF